MVAKLQSEIRKSFSTSLSFELVGVMAVPITHVVGSPLIA